MKTLLTGIFVGGLSLTTMAVAQNPANTGNTAMTAQTCPICGRTCPGPSGPCGQGDGRAAVQAWGPRRGAMMGLRGRGMGPGPGYGTCIRMAPQQPATTPQSTPKTEK